MNNKFLEELAEKPIVNTFKLSYKLFWSNKFLFTVITTVFVFFSIIQFVIPFTFANVIAETSIVLMTLVGIFMYIIPQILTEANYLFVARLVIDAQSEERCVSTMASTMVLPLFSNYFVRALGSSLAVVLISMPLIFMREQLSMGAYWDMFLLVLLLLALYIYPIVVYKTTLSKNFKEAFLATFLLFSPTVWKQSFNVAYAKFVIAMMIILSGLFYVVLFAIDNLPTIGNMYMVLMPMVIMTIFMMFVILYVFPVAMMIAQSLIAKKLKES